jgi:uncharacterized membrane protein YbhN (UPF0104 family)
MPAERAALPRPGGAATPPAPERSRWATLRRVATVLFVLVVLGLVVNHARTIEWSAVGDALKELPARSLALAAALAAASHAVYATYDLIGRRHTGHAVPALRVLGVTFVSYAFNLNLGALVGGIAFRYRLYARQGLDVATTTQVLTLSLLTNWLGYLALAGGLFLLAPPELPPDWSIATGGLRAIGAGMLVAAAGYVLACFVSPRREWTLRGRTLRLPSGRLAALQLGLSCLNWLLIAGVVFVLLQGRIEYATVLGVLLLAAVAGAVAHVPAGLGVLEAVFVALLAGQLGQEELLAALLAYRAIYYLAPLALAIALFPLLDRRGGSAARATGDRSA